LQNDESLTCRTGDLARGLGVVTAIGTAQLPSAGGYARTGPNVAPAVVAGGLFLLGLRLFETLSGGWRNAVP